MMGFLRSVMDVVTDRSAKELVGALLIALFLSLLVTGLFGLVRRKVSDPTILMCSLTIVACIASMVVAAGYLELAAERDRPAEASALVGSPLGRTMMARRIMEGADNDRNGNLSPEEASRGAAKFVEWAAGNTQGPVDEEALRNALKYWLGQPPTTGPPPLPAKPDLAQPR